MSSVLITPILKWFYGFIFLITAIACGSEKPGDMKGDSQAIELAKEMIQNIGGPERWKSLSSLYISAIHHEKRLDKPYRSEIWRNLDPVRIKIVQTGDDFIIKRVIVDDKGWVVREDQKTPMSEGSLNYLKNWDKHLFYRLLRDIARERPMKLTLSGERSFTISKEDDFWARITLSREGLPYKYETLAPEGDTLVTLYPEWATSEGFRHPSIAMAPDSSFVFKATQWKHSTTKYPDSFFRQ